MRTKTSLFAIVGVMSVVGVTSAFGAATVRTLGGAGTYTGVSSAAAAKNSGTTASGTATTRSRAGTIRVNPSVSMSGSGAKTTQTVTTANSGATVSSGNDGVDSRMSIGKYLNGSALTSFGKSSSGTPSDGTIGLIQSDISDLQNQVAGHDTDISNLESVIDGYDADISVLKNTVGDDISGLVADVAGLSDTVGDDTTGLVADVADLQNTIGDGETAGLLKRVADLESAGSPDMSAYATQAWVNERHFLTEHQDLSDYATKDMLTDLPAAPSGTGSGGAIYVLNKETDAGAPTWEKVVVQQNWDE